MFRPLRRNKQTLTMEEILPLLEKGSYGILSMLGVEGYPYGVPVNYVYFHEALYFHSAISGHKIEAMKKNDKVSFVIIGKSDVVSAKLTTFFQSVILFGRVSFLEDSKERKEAMMALGKKYSPMLPDSRIEQEIERDDRILSVIKMEIDHISGKKAIELCQENPKKQFPQEIGKE